MLLRRFSKHFSEQNWFAVGLDVIVVITGIFLGLQVTEWNDDRKIRLKEAVYIKQFQTDIETSITLGKEFRLNNEAFKKATEVLAAMAASPSLKIDEDTFDDNMSGGLYELDDFRFVRKTWKELINSGQYNQFGDVELRQLIDRVVEKQDLMSSRVENLTIYTRDIVDSWLTKNYDMWRIHALKYVNTKRQTGIPKSIGDIDVEAILSDRTFINILAYRRLFVTQYLSDYSEMHADYKLLQKTLADKLIALEE